MNNLLTLADMAAAAAPAPTHLGIVDNWKSTLTSNFGAGNDGLINFMTSLTDGGLIGPVQLAQFNESPSHMEALFKHFRSPPQSPSGDGVNPRRRRWQAELLFEASKLAPESNVGNDAGEAN